MSILICGMEMPKNCKSCMDTRLNVAVSVFGAMCPFCEKIFLADIDIKKQRLDDCPLVEIPTPHGRLGDLDALKAQYKYGEADSEDERLWMMNIRRAITNAPTVIEAEGSET